MQTIIIALGANIPGGWGPPAGALEHALGELCREGLVLVDRSHLYVTTPLGLLRQPDFLNLIAVFRGSIGPAGLLHLAKRIERRAGRRLGPRWGARVLDIDVVDFGGRRIGRPGRRLVTGALLLPHPGAHQRGFVLVPLAEAAPHWRHPQLGLRAGELLRRAPHLRRGVKLRRV